MKNNWLPFKNLEIDGRSPYNFPSEFQLSQAFAINILSQFTSLFDNSFHCSNHVYISGSLALQEAFSCISKLAISFSVWVSTRSSSNVLHKLSHEPLNSNSSHSQSFAQIKHITSGIQIPYRLQFGSGSNNGHPVPSFLKKLANFTLRHIWKEVEQHDAGPILSLAAAVIPPIDSRSTKALIHSIALEDNGEQISGPISLPHIEDNYQGCPTPVADQTGTEDAIEPKTGIKFPTFLEDNYRMTNGVLVGIGSRSMRIIKLRSLKLYAFGLYVHPDSVCKRLGPKYASVPVCELMNRSDFLEDLLREDIHMTVRLVVNYNGLKINTVRDAFEKSLRTRLQKMNPNTDYHCLSVFGSYFTEDIPLPAGTTIDFRQTADGQLITEIGGRHVGAVHSKDLCKAFFDMYIGDVPVSQEAKQEIAQNVAGLVKRC